MEEYDRVWWTCDSGDNTVYKHSYTQGLVLQPRLFLLFWEWRVSDLLQLSQRKVTKPFCLNSYEGNVLAQGG